MTRRTNGEGNVYRRPDGRWEVRLQLSGRRLSAYGRTRSEALEGLRRLQKQAEKNGRLPENPKLTVGEYLQAWLETAKDRLRPTTLADYRIIITKHVVPYIGGTRLAKVTPLQVARLYSTLAQAGLSPRRRQMVHGLLHKAFGDAHRWGLIASNPAASVDAPKREHKERHLWTPEQVVAFLSAVVEGQGGQYGYLFGFLLASGCRLGEALGLRWSDVDFAAGTVRIERQVVQIGNAFHEGPPKTKAGVRDITLPAWGLELLRRQRAQVAAWRMQSVRVFPARTGATPERANVRRALCETCDRLGLPRIRVHDLRHLSLSLLAMAGVPVKVTQARAGHSSPNITMAVYTHALGDADRQAAQALESLATGRRT